MQTPKILAALANDRAAHNISQKFENALKAIEQGVADKKMYNADYENFKYWINEGCDKALDAAAEPWRELYRQGQRNIPYKESDPRFTIGYSVSPLHARGLLNRLKKYANEPAVAPYIAVLEEVAPVGELLKQLKPFIVKGRRPNENPVEVDNTNTGVCPVCLRRQKLTFDSKMVDHGYTVPHGWGGRNGHCLGFKHAPYELSSEGCVYFLSIQQRVSGAS